MKARTMRAALDWNSKEREALLDDEGNVKQSVVYSKRRKASVKKICYKKSEMKHTYPLLLRLLEVYLQKVAPPQIYVPESLARSAVGQLYITACVLYHLHAAMPTVTNSH